MPGGMEAVEAPPRQSAVDVGRVARECRGADAAPSPRGGAEPLSPDAVRQIDALRAGVARMEASDDAGSSEPSGQFTQVHENDLARVVVVCAPGIPKMMGALHPAGSLYERPVNLETAKAEHRGLRAALRRFGVKVLSVREILRYGLDDNLRHRVELEDFCMGSLHYCQRESSEGDSGSVAEKGGGGGGGVQQDETQATALRFHLSDEYKRQVLESMGHEQLIDVAFTNPTVYVQGSYRDTGISAEYSFRPLTNLVFSRDQQITTARGIVMASLRSEQRDTEGRLMRFCLDKIGLPVIGDVKPPGFLEGGDFFPAGEDLCFIGVGLRSNMEACKQLMERDLLGTRRVAVVLDKFDQSQDRMHLDCVFSIIHDDCVLLLEDIMGSEAPGRRLVAEFVRGADGHYRPVDGPEVEFSEFLQLNGFNIIPISPQQQLEYACNILNLGDGNILSAHAESARHLCRSPHFKGQIQHVPFDAVTAMYGALHCSTQVVSRAPLPRRVAKQPARRDREDAE